VMCARARGGRGKQRWGKGIGRGAPYRAGLPVSRCRGSAWRLILFGLSPGFCCRHATPGTPVALPLAGMWIACDSGPRTTLPVPACVCRGYVRVGRDGQWSPPRTKASPPLVHVRGDREKRYWFFLPRRKQETTASPFRVPGLKLYAVCPSPPAAAINIRSRINVRVYPNHIVAAGDGARVFFRLVGRIRTRCHDHECYELSEHAKKAVPDLYATPHMRHVAANAVLW
jgi:hypothetical protein